LRRALGEFGGRDAANFFAFYKIRPRSLLCAVRRDACGRDRHRDFFQRSSIGFTRPGTLNKFIFGKNIFR
jgi:hypothetical protein